MWHAVVEGPERVKRISKHVRSSHWQLVAMAMLCCGWAGNEFTPLLVLYRDLGYSAAMVDAFFGAYVVGLVPGLLVGGPLSDRHGRRPVMVAGTALSGLAGAVLAAGTGALWLYVGRFLAGIAVGIAMAVGSSWIKELSSPPYEPSADPGAGARRASLALTAGFAAGAAAAGVLAQWAPWPTVLPYLVQVVLAVPCTLAVARAPQPRPAGVAGPLWTDLKVPAAGHRRFLGVVLPLAPWVFGAAGVAYAITPQLEAARTGQWQLAYATLLAVVALGTGVAVQPVAKSLDRLTSARGSLVALGLVLVGVLATAANAAPRSPWAAIVIAAVLGAGYSIALVSGLGEIQRIATPRDLAGLTGVYYAVSYTGFLLPAALAVASASVSYTVLFLAVAGLVVCSLALVLVNSTRNLPADPGRDQPAGALRAQPAMRR